MHRADLLPLLALAGLACGEPPTPVARPSAVVSVPTASAPVEDVAPTPLPEAPEDLVLVLRVRAPARTLEVARSFHPGVIDLAKELAARTDGASEFMDLGAPWDVGVVVDQAALSKDRLGFLTAVSVPLRGDVAAFVALVESKGDRVEPIGPGHHRIVSGERLRCDVWGAAERGRLVCSDGVPGLKQLGAWMGRTLDAEPAPAGDASLEVKMGPLREPIARDQKKELRELVAELRRGFERSGIEGADLLTLLDGGAEEIDAALADVEGLTASLKVGASAPELSFTGSLRFRSKSSTAAKLALSGLAPAAPPGELAKVPADADVVWFGRGLDEASLTGPRAVARRAVELAIDVAGAEGFRDLITPKDKASYLGAFDKLPVPSGPWVLATGALPPPAKPATNDGSPKALVAIAERRFAEAIGWTVLAGDGDAERLTGSIKAALEAGDTHVKLRLAELDRRGGKKGFWKARRDELARIAPTWKLRRDPAGYPKGSALFEVTFGFDNVDVRQVVELEEFEVARPTAKPKVELGKVPVKVVVVPGDGGRLLVGVSADAATLQARVLATRVGGAGSWAERPEGTSELSRAGAGGFVAFGPPLRRLLALDAGDRDVVDVLSFLDGLPKRGGGRASIALSVEGADAPTLTFSLRGDRAVAADVFSALRLP